MWALSVKMVHEEPPQDAPGIPAKHTARGYNCLLSRPNARIGISLIFWNKLFSWDGVACITDDFCNALLRLSSWTLMQQPQVWICTTTKLQVTHSPPSPDHKKSMDIWAVCLVLFWDFSKRFPLCSSFCSSDYVHGYPHTFHVPAAFPYNRSGAFRGWPSMHASATKLQSTLHCFAKDSYLGLRLLRKFLLKIF